MKIIIMTEEQIHKEYEELSKVLSGAYDKNIFEKPCECRKTLGVGRKGEIIKASSYNSLQDNQSVKQI